MPIKALCTGVLKVLDTPAARALCWLTAAILTATLFGLGATPVAVGIAAPPWDKLLHFLTYGGLSTLFAIALGWRSPLLAAGLGIALGCLDETLQLFEPGRQAGLDDLAADVLAALIAAYGCHWLAGKFK